MPRRPRLPTNVIDNLEEITAILLEMWAPLNDACDRARERYQDPVLLGDLNEVVRRVADIEFHVGNARHGKFVERRRGHDGIHRREGGQGIG